MDGFTDEFNQTFKEKLTLFIFKLFPKFEEEETLSYSKKPALS